MMMVNFDFDICSGKTNSNYDVEQDVDDIADIPSVMCTTGMKLTLILFSNTT